MHQLRVTNRVTRRVIISLDTTEVEISGFGPTLPTYRELLHPLLMRLLLACLLLLFDPDLEKWGSESADATQQRGGVLLTRSMLSIRIGLKVFLLRNAKLMVACYVRHGGV